MADFKPSLAGLCEAGGWRHRLKKPDAKALARHGRPERIALTSLETVEPFAVRVDNSTGFADVKHS